jgi:endonuclease YncB( thermonuclease family)
VSAPEHRFASSVRRGSAKRSWLSIHATRFTPQRLASLSLLCTLVGFSTYADVLSGHVVRVVDGDTITVLDEGRQQHKVRLAGIDAPETKQPYGQASRKHLGELVASKTVAVEWTKHDKYGRIVGKVMVASPDACPDARPECPKTLDACLAQITSGLAWHFKRYESEQSEEDRHRYAFAEEEATAKRVGLWKEPNPIPPWEWRRQERIR